MLCFALAEVEELSASEERARKAAAVAAAAEDLRQQRQAEAAKAAAAAAAAEAAEGGEEQKRGQSRKRFGCLALGTPVAMADGSTKAIEDIVVGDCVASWSYDTNCTTAAAATAAASFPAAKKREGEVGGEEERPHHIIFGAPVEGEVTDTFAFAPQEVAELTLSRIDILPASLQGF